MTKKGKGGTPPEEIMDWFYRMGLDPEELTDIYTARGLLSQHLEGTAQYPYSEAQGRSMDWLTENVARPMQEAGVRGHVAWNVQGYFEIRYGVKGVPGLYGWERAQGFIERRTGVLIPKTPYGF